MQYKILRHLLCSVSHGRVIGGEESRLGVQVELYATPVHGTLCVSVLGASSLLTMQEVPSYIVLCLLIRSRFNWRTTLTTFRVQQPARGDKDNSLTLSDKIMSTTSVTTSGLKVHA